MVDLIRRYRIKFWRFFVMPFANARFVRTPALFESVVSSDPKKIFIITSAFNDPVLVEMHHRSLETFLQDPYEQFIVDNSTNEEAAGAIKKFCLQNKVNYMRLPFNIGNQRRDAGIAHGLALNWAYRNVVMRFKPEVFGIWDYDLFPTKPVNISNFMSISEGWGIAIKLRPLLRPWHYPAYLWVGLLFFRRARFKGKMQNFLPTFGVDSGGRIPLDGEIMAAIPGMIDFYASPFIEIAPGVRMRQCGDFVHFEGSSSGPSDALDLKKKWMENVLRSA